MMGLAFAAVVECTVISYSLATVYRAKTQEGMMRQQMVHNSRQFIAIRHAMSVPVPDLINDTFYPGVWNETSYWSQDSGAVIPGAVIRSITLRVFIQAYTEMCETLFVKTHIRGLTTGEMLREHKRRGSQGAILRDNKRRGTPRAAHVIPLCSCVSHSLGKHNK